MLKNNTIIKKNEKFSTAMIGCFLRLPLTKHNLAYASLLARMQMNASLYFPTLKSQQIELDKLYDLQFEIMPQLFGRELIISYTANFVEPLELLDPDYNYARIAEQLALMIQFPSFAPSLVNFTQRQLAADYQELIEEPANLAIDHFFKIWYQASPDYAENFMGPIEEIEQATPEQVKRFSDNLRTMPACILGYARDPQQLSYLLKQEFKLLGLHQEFQVNNPGIAAPHLNVEKTEKKENLQTQLLIGFGYLKDQNYQEQTAGMLLAQYLAGDPSSKLFTEIREKLGAAYDVEANNYANNSLFLISAGLDPNKVKEAQKIICQTIEQIKNGQIDEAIFKKAKKTLINTQLIGSDQQNWQLAQLLRSELFQNYADFDRISAIKSISKSQLKRFAQNLFFNESYVLK